MVCELSRSRDGQVTTSLPRLPAQSETSRQPIPPQQHPLDPLTPEEIQRAVAILRQQKPITPEWRFAIIQLQEPDRRWMSTWKPGMDWDRQAFVVLLDRSSGSTYEAIVSLAEQQVCSWQLISGVQPGLLDDEVYECDRLLKEDPAFLAALARRGIQDVSLVMVDYWTIGYFGIPEEQGQRLVRGLCFLRSEPCDNGYARPIEGLSPWIDLNRMQVVKIEDRGLWPLPPESSNFDELFFKDFRTDLKPLEITQPQGVSFQVEGHHIRWQKWDLRISFNPREGLVLHQVGYEDQSPPGCGEQGRIRPILYRASVAEMVVPYGDPRDPHFRKNAFDVGEYAIGMQANSLQLGCDCLGEIYYFDAYLHTNSGEPMLLKNAVCMHEEDFGILWKHSDWRTERAQVRRSRRLVISFFTTVGNYDYGFFWYFYQDGTLEFEAKLTGIINTCATLPGEDPEFGTLVAPQLAGLNHQHFFTVRLDMAVDGDHNSLYEVHSQALPLGPENPHGNAFRAQSTLLKTEQQAAQSVDPLQGRYWKIVNPQSRNRLGQAVGYKLLPGENVQLLAQPDSWLYRRAGYLANHLWATPYHPEENFPAGDYPNQHPGGEGLVNWTQANRSIENTELVLWYSFGCNHLPRPEDWPVMPVSYIGFMLKPVGFFDRNPALDVPPSPPKTKGCCGSSLN